MFDKRSSTPPKNGRRVVELSELTTRELVALAQTGDLEAFDPLYRRYAEPVLRNAIVRAGGDRQWGEDLASEVWATALAQIGQWQGRTDDLDADPEDDFRRWLFGITRCLVANTYARRRREVTAAPEGGWESAAPLVMAAEPDSPGRSPVKVELLASLLRAVDELCERQREVVKLALDGLSNAEIAQKTGMTLAQVHSTWTTAQITLRRRLIDPMKHADPAQLRAAARMLPGVQRTVAMLRLDGFRDGEIAQRTGIDYRRVRDAWDRAKDGIRRRLAEAGTVDVDEERAARRAAAAERDRDRLREIALSFPSTQRRVALLRLDGKLWREIDAALGIKHGSAESVWRQLQPKFALALTAA